MRNKFLIETHKNMTEITDLTLAENRVFIIVEKKREKIEKALELAEHFLNKWGRFREQFYEIDGLDVKLKSIVKEVFINDNNNNSKGSHFIFLTVSKENLREVKETVLKLLEDEAEGK